MQIARILSILFIFTSACTVLKKNESEVASKNNSHEHGKDNNHDNNMSAPVESDKLERQGIKELFTNYFHLKDGFVISNKQIILNYSGGLFRTVKVIDKNNLKLSIRSVWLNQTKSLEKITSEIANERDLVIQRKSFIALSKKMYDLAKVANLPQTIYYQYYKMSNESEGVYWLSLEKEIRNPYYGSKMLSKGNTIEVIRPK